MTQLHRSRTVAITASAVSQCAQHVLCSRVDYT